MINADAELTAGNHSVSLIATDSTGHSAQKTVHFTLGNKTRANCESMLTW